MIKSHKLYDLMREAGYATPELATRALTLAARVEVEAIRNTKRETTILLISLIHQLGYTGQEAEELFRGL